jgi:RNA polymerase sigma-70 factor (ECF subfamily)
MPITNRYTAMDHHVPAFADEESAMFEKAKLPQRMDETAFCAFYRDTGPILRSYIRRVSGDAARADDILQTFYRFLQADLPALEKFQMMPYLYRVANSLLSDHWRRLKRERRWSLTKVFRTESPENPGHGDDTRRVFQRLKTQEQTLLWLAYVEGFDHREIASALELKEKSIRVLLFRARRKLAGMLNKESIGPGEGI